MELPSLTPVTTAATTITSSTATLNGNISQDGGAAITARGFVYATSNANLTIDNTAADTVIVSGTTGVFEKDITGLTAGTTYYYKAYATNIVLVRAMEMNKVLLRMQFYLLRILNNRLLPFRQTRPQVL